MKPIPIKHGGHAWVDDEDFDRISQFKWRKNLCGRPFRTVSINGKRGALMLHRAVLNLGLGREPEIDHINCDVMDNRKENLRECTHQENCRNVKCRRPGRLKGAHVNKRNNSWNAHIKVNGKAYHLGVFKTEAEAHSVYCIEAAWRFGNFARFA